MLKTELDPISPQISTLAFIFLCFFLSCYPHFFFFIMFLFLLFLFSCYFLTCYFFSTTLLLFFRGKIVTFFPVSLPPSRLLPFFLLLFFLPKTVTFFPVTFFPVTFFPSTDWTTINFTHASHLRVMSFLYLAIDIGSSMMPCNHNYLTRDMRLMLLITIILYTCTLLLYLYM